MREGKWSSQPARVLVPGDIILCKLGDVIPADSILIDGHGELQMDQAALTGESLPVDKNAWEKLLMGSAVKRGEAHAVVTQTGPNTFLGKAAGLIASVKSEGHLQKVLLNITIWLLVTSIVLCAAIFARLYTLPENPFYLANAHSESKIISSLSVVIVILVASIPIAIEVVCTSTLAVGSHRMAHMKVIVARLSAIEELASMSILCSDKTGTLTLNKLSLREPMLFGDCTVADLNFFSYLASKKDKGSQDAIDFCIGNNLTDEQAALALTYKEELFIPFNPTEKRTLAKLVTPTGEYIEVTKGAPQVTMRMAWNASDIEAKVVAAVQALGDRGFRSLGVGINRAGRGVTPKWEYLGILSLFDPPRHDTKATIERAHAFNIEVKMVTGDHGVIARETCRELGMGTNILNTEHLDTGIDAESRRKVNKTIREADGFAEVMPEHKFLIVERLREMGFVTGMTGDGVNDAPALKRADVGIAVAGATDAARAAADLVLTEEGLGVIIDAIFESRKIFQRMRNYIVYRIACTIQLLFFFFLVVMVISPDTDYMYGSPETSVDAVAWYQGPGRALYQAKVTAAASGSPIALFDAACYGGSTTWASCKAVALASFPESEYLKETCIGTTANLACPAMGSLFFGRSDRPCIGNDLTYNGLTIPGLENCHAEAFTLPVIAMVIITILNDGCMITISGDFVTPNKHPQTWDMMEVAFISIGLGLSACLSSLLLVAFCMHANQFHPGNFMGNVFGSSGRNYLTWFEVRTILYLKVSISDFLTLFSARTISWFWERKVGKYLAIAATFALTTSTLLALFWGDIFYNLQGAYMASLRFSKGAVLATWAYCILWWFAQDALKIVSHYWWDSVIKTHQAVAKEIEVDAVGLEPESTSKVNSSNSSLNSLTALAAIAALAKSTNIDPRFQSVIPQNSIGRAAKKTRAAIPSFTTATI